MLLAVVVLPSQVLVLLLEVCELLVEFEERLLEYLVFLFLGKVQRLDLLSPLLYDLAVGVHLFLQDLDGQVQVVVEFFQQAAHLRPVQVPEPLHYDLQIGLQVVVVRPEALLAVGDYGVLARQVALGQQRLHLQLA